MAGKADDRGANNAPAQPPSPPRPTSPKVDRDQCDKTREVNQSRDHDHDSHSRYDKTGASSPTTRDSDDDQPGQPPRKRQRVRLSCLECRRRKLSCDRSMPCERCIRSGTPEICSYETRPGLAPPAKNGLSQGALSSFESRLSHPPPPPGEYRRDSILSRDNDRIRRLESEVAQLKNLLLAKVGSSSLDGTATLADGSPAEHSKPDYASEIVPGTPPPRPPNNPEQDNAAEEDELRFFRGKEFKTRYFGPHNAYMAFSELTSLYPFMKETADEWLSPLHIPKNKDRNQRKLDRERKAQEPDPTLEALLPTKQETDILVEVYLEQFEQVYRIIHTPTFRKSYARFWDPMLPRTASFTALVLVMISVSCCLHGNTSGTLVGSVSHAHYMAEKWTNACENWHRNQSEKHRKLIHLQIACLIHLSKRVNILKKKRFWKSAGALVQDGISVGLHRDPGHVSDKISVYNQEMRRRLWATIQEFDLQASFDHGLPSLLSSLHFDITPPRNIDDEEFDEDVKSLPKSKPPNVYTFSSFQHLSRQSLPLRLELSRVLTGSPEELDYERVIRYTNEITQEIDSLPSWDLMAAPTLGPGAAPGSSLSSQISVSSRRPLLAYTLLHIQLRQYIIPLHQPYLRLRKTNSKYQYSEIVYYNAARDMVLLHDKLTEQGVRTLSFLREDALTLSINLCSVTMLQPRGSTNMVMVNSEHTLRLLEKCLAMKEDRVLRCGNHEPWAYSIMCAAYGLLEAHLGVKTAEVAKAGAAERFVNLHYRLVKGENPPASSMQSILSNRAALQQPQNYEGRERQKSITPFAIPSSQGSAMNGVHPGEAPPTPWWLNPVVDPSIPALPQSSFNPEFNLENLGLNLNDLWSDATLGFSN
ncbi:hypothetical protein PgNI_05797 [Pyricularia grisea]|uniref:Zn(2)-C6 fungal-type domain-containing protein n=1 Tax=Pyricularia grisea TaxID=148305 RepID=A0A6P8B3G5_PYRGI|nr:hypothetical protein PgNI_05797 [Pyricularia grisea]TLD09886.1 hypothetical protein PgNI_05797 [Pyricularia grisea]